MAKPTKATAEPSPAGQIRQHTNPSRVTESHFPIVAIGASAGGMEAVEQFLRQVPAKSGMAFVLIHHMARDQKDLMPEILQRSTAMRVLQANDRMRVKPEHVYVIPPDKDMSIRHGVLHLTEASTPHGLRLPVDVFFRSLAEDRQQLAIGVVLSGMGSDGTQGLREIKENAGLTLAQDPADAKFDGMPRSAIDTGVADIVATAAELPDRILKFLLHAALVTRTEADADAEAEAHSALDKVVLLLRVQTSHDFSLYKKSTLYRRIERRMAIHQIDRISSYVNFLREKPQEVDLLFKELLIGVTSFFRDTAAWDLLRDEALPALFAAAPEGRGLRAWVAGCSTGEEAYSLAILFKEALAKYPPAEHFSLQIYATDLDPNAIDKARQGTYPASIAGAVSEERLNRYFVANENSYTISKEIREMVVFATQNVIMDPPFTKLDILCCRNLLIYLGPELQKKLLPLFHYGLNPGGILFLGSAESVGNFSNLFAPIDAKLRIYRRTEINQRAADVEFPTRLFYANQGNDEHKTPHGGASFQSQADQLLLRNYSPAAVFVNGNGDIVYINGRTGKYLEPAAGKANWNIYAMAREGLRHELAGAMHRAQQQKTAITTSGLKLEENGTTHYLNLVVEPITEPEALAGMYVVVFHDLPPPSNGSRVRRSSVRTDLAELELEVRSLREQLQTAREEMQSSEEELKSANEELQSTNEELQSTNEELTTSKEEMQSLNEELQTVNAELTSKVEDLSRYSNDMKNLLNSTDIAIVFLDNSLHVRRFTNSATRIIKLIPGDVGRPLSDIVSDLDYPSLAHDCQEVLRTLVFCETEVPSHDDRWFLVRIMPYRTAENVIDGVVITFIDVTKTKTLEAQLRAALDRSDGGAPKK
ncbi:MAG TPA: chemotaxis protein CheB [Rhodocyclaceae bacterium]|nr:chemotaxis protein CheB [Rhodocyclaceae bacterium]